MDIDSTIAWIQAATFGEPTGRPPRIGVEAEVIPIDSATREIASLSRLTLPALEEHASRYGWCEVATTKGAPKFAVPGGGCLTFEPGGQIEYATPPFDVPSALLTHLDSIIVSLTDSMHAHGIELSGTGIDPFNSADRAALQIDAERYRLMDAYYATLGSAGARMMRQTASIQINVDAGENPARLWRLLNALSPVLTAVFANSRRYAGLDTGFANFRAHTWQTLDATRTGIVPDEGSPAASYARFALDATAMFTQDEEGHYRPYRHWVERGAATPQTTTTHLSTLFPEVRPRRYFELRSIDALPREMYAAPVLLVAGLLLDASARDQAVELLGTTDPALLETAARHGLNDPRLAGLAAQVVDIAISGCCRRGESFTTSHIDEAEAFFDRFTRQRRSPGDDASGVLTVATAA